MSNEIIATNETSKVTKQLCMDYLKSQNTNLTDGEMMQYVAVATALNLNPFLREIYPIKYGQGKMTLVTGYQVYIRRAEEFPQYDGFETAFEGYGKELSCICKVYRKDRTRPTISRVYMAEYAQDNSMWKSKPHVMLEKVAIGTAFRRAFPSEFNGMPYTSEEVGTAEDELKAQGYTEVKVEPAAHENKNGAKKLSAEESTKAFQERMEALEKAAPEVFANALNVLNYPDIHKVPVEKRAEVYKHVRACVNKALQAEKEVADGTAATEGAENVESATEAKEAN